MRSVQVMYPQIAISVILLWVGLGIRQLLIRAIVSGRQLPAIRAFGWICLGAGVLFLTYALVSFLPVHKPAVLNSVEVATLLAVAGGWVSVRYRRASTGRQRALGTVGWVLLSGAALALIYALAVLLGRLLAGLSWLNPAQLPAALGVGAILAASGTWTLSAIRTGFPRRAVMPAERASQFIALAVIVLALFWLANIFATAYGARDAENFASQVVAHPNVVVDTTEKLYLNDQKVCEIPIPADSSQRFLYRYKNLRELAARNDRWFLVPTDWQKNKGFVLIIPMRDDSVRLRIEQIPEHATVLCSPS
ncbi:hypothetical protein ACFQZZ_29725 [Nocardia sp. GCM10030253]|uniref:hypothetical protein n=1 Tax=Nocardia sp. GCM10030253 TaxID=3273404 RepID=UPI0036254909